VRTVLARMTVVLVFAFCLASMAFADSVVIAPHLQNITADGVTIIWETEEAGAGAVEYGPDDTLGRTASEAAPATIHRVRVAGLDPETVYHYRVVAADTTFASTFKTAPDGVRPITYAVLGDTRRWHTGWQDTRMADHMLEWDPEFIINTGDLVVDGHKKEQWPEHFDRFSDTGGGLMMVTARGNHEGSQRNDTENDWFAKYHDLPGEGEPYASFDWGNTHFVFISFESIAKSADWLDAHLATVDRPHTVVVFHYPMYCTGYRSYDDSRKQPGRQYATLAGILDKHDVGLHISGHTHIYERVYPLRGGQRDNRRGTTYIVQGGDINAQYPDWWSAVTDDPATMSEPTYTIVQSQADRMVVRTFAWSPPKQAIVEIDHTVIVRDEAIPAAVLEGLDGQEGADLVAAIEALGAMIHGPAAPALLAYLGHADLAVRRAAATALRAIGQSSVVESLTAYLEDPDLPVRREVARALEIALPESLAKTVVPYIKDAGQDDVVRVRLIGALQLHAPAKLAMTALKDVLDSDAPEAVRQRAAHALAHRAEEKDIKTLTRIVGDEADPFVMSCLAYRLNKLTRQRVRLRGDAPLAQSAPGQRKEFIDKWLSKK